MKRLALVTVLAAAAALAPALPASAATAPPAYKNCTAMHAKYPHGIGKVGAKDHVKGTSKPVTTFLKNNAGYAHNTKLDADKDGVACEKK